MLVLSRKAGESIVLSYKGRLLAEVRVVDIRTDRVKLGIEAGQSIQVDREEVYLSKQTKKQEVTDGSKREAGVGHRPFARDN